MCETHRRSVLIRDGSDSKAAGKTPELADPDKTTLNPSKDLHVTSMKLRHRHMKQQEKQIYKSVMKFHKFKG